MSAAGAGALGVLLDAGEDGQSQKADVDEIAKIIAEALTELCKKDENGKEVLKANLYHNYDEDINATKHGIVYDLKTDKFVPIE